MQNFESSHRVGGVATACLLAAALAGCASPDVTFERRDLTGTYDGVWVVRSISTERMQKAGPYVTMTCRHQDFRVPFEIADATLEFWEGRTAYVGPEGRFTTRLPTEDQVRQGAGSEVPISGNFTLILRGELSPVSGSGDGTLTYGLAQFNNRGCTTKLGYTRVQ